MKTFSAFFASALFDLPAAFTMGGVASADRYVRGYTRSNGTRVQNHYRSSPNSTVTNNLAYSGNYNPHTDERGSRSYSSYRRKALINLLELIFY